MSCSAYLQHVFYSASRVTLHHAFHPYQRLDLRIQTIAHELELAVGRDEADGSVVLKSTQSHALVELDIFHFHRLSSCRSARRLKHDFVIQAETEFGHARQIALHFNGAENLGA